MPKKSIPGEEIMARATTPAPLSHVRIDGAWRGGIDISINNTYTSRAFDISTKDLAQYSQSGGQCCGFHVSNPGRVMVFAGGIPLTRGRKVLGGVRVSGGSESRVTP
jgi:uncharacterized protein GlcG (DUF336 family)